MKKMFARNGIHVFDAKWFITSDCPRKWIEIFKPITKRGNAKPKQTRIYFRHLSEFKTALCQNYNFASRLGGKKKKYHVASRLGHV